MSYKCMIEDKGTYKKSSLAYYNPYCTTWEQFFSSFVYETISFNEENLPEKYSLLIVSKKQIFMEKLSVGNDNYEWLSNLEALKKINSKVKETFDIVFVLDADTSVRNYIKYTELVKPEGMLFVVFSPKKKIDEVEEELDKIKIFKQGDMILSKYHVLEFLKKDNPEYNYFGAVLSIYLGKGAEDFETIQGEKKPENNFELFIAEWINTCKKLGAVPCIEYNYGKGILKISYRTKNIDLQKVKKEFNELVAKHKLEKKDAVLRINLGSVEVDITKEE